MHTKLRDGMLPTLNWHGSYVDISEESSDSHLVLYLLDFMEREKLCKATEQSVHFLKESIYDKFVVSGYTAERTLNLFGFED